jgi:hypothetical protein
VAGQLDLNLLDSPDVEQTHFGPDMKRWLTNAVDIINERFIALDNLIQVLGVEIGGGGVGPISVPVIGLTSDGFVNARIISTSNPDITILTVTPGANAFDITFSDDPGASAIIVYQAFSPQPQ